MDEGLAVEGNQQSDDHGYGDDGIHHEAGLDRLLILSLAKEDLPGHAEVVINRHDAVEHADVG